MHEVGPPREKSTFWTRTATAETVNTHFVHSNLVCNNLSRLTVGTANYILNSC